MYASYVGCWLSFNIGKSRERKISSQTGVCPVLVRVLARSLLLSVEETLNMTGRGSVYTALVRSVSEVRQHLP